MTTIEKIPSSVKDGERWKITYRQTPTSYSANSYVHVNMLGNPDLCTIGSFNNVLSVDESKDGLRDMMLTLSEKTGKHLFIFDVNQSYAPKIAKMSPIFQQKYLSTNGSNMMLGIIDTETLKQKI